MSSDDFTKQLQMACRAEGQEHVQLLLNALVKIEFASAAEAATLIEQSFRSLHNIKGSAHAAEFYTIESLCHPMEDVVSAVKSGTLTTSSALIDVLLEGVSLVDCLLKEDDQAKYTNLIEAVLGRLAAFSGKEKTDDDQEESPPDESMPDEQALSVDMTAGNSPSGGHTSHGAAKQTNGGHNMQQETLRVSTRKLDLLMQKAEEMLALKAMVRQNSATATDVKRTIDYYAKAWSKATPDVKQARELINLMLAVSTSATEQLPWRTMSSTLDAFGEVLEQVNADMKDLTRGLTEAAHATASSVDMLLDDTKNLLMISCNSLFAGFPLVARQLARQLGKEISITIEGGDIEMDRRMLGQLKDPLIHILRNSIDHGIETPSERIAAGKPPKGTLAIAAAQVDRMVELRIADDGQGIDTTRVKASAVKHGLISQEEANKLSELDAQRLIFQSSLSTSAMITEISGRGIGLAIVEEKIQDLGGTITVETEVGKGTAFIIRLPITIATFRGVLVQVAGRLFVVPTVNIDRVVTIQEDVIKSVDGTDTFLFDGTLIPLAAMAAIIKLPPSFKAFPDRLLTVMVVRAGQDKAGLIVDEIIGEQEVLVKSLGPVFSGVTGVLGATVLGSGQVVPILNISEVLKTYKQRRTGMKTIKRLAAGDQDADKEMPESIPSLRTRVTRETAHVLVVDDMVTARMLMRNIFESAGFKVTTANNGLDALNLLREGSFDVVVTDLEMPLMDGFKLTESIRATEAMKTLPVVVVTSMASRADRERGVAAGANAYFVKSSFDQANLLEVVSTLV